MIDGSECSYVIDCDGLLEIARTKSNNLKQLYLDSLQTGLIGVPACVWQEFQGIYQDEATALSPYVTKKIKMKQSYYVGAASIADKINSRFSPGPYDEQTDLYAASICLVEEYALLTTTSQLGMYEKMQCGHVFDLTGWADSQGTPK